MLPAHFDDVTDDISHSWNQICAGVQLEVQEQSRNDKDHPTSNTEQNTRTKRVQQENKEHDTMPQSFPTSSPHCH